MHDEYNAQRQDKVANAKKKDDYTILPWGAIRHAVPVFAVGAEKYEPLGYYKVKDRRWVYVKACMRHMAKFFIGVARGESEPLDEDDGLPHLHHALACLMIAVDDSQDDVMTEPKIEPKPETARSVPHPPVKSMPVVIGETD